MKYEHSILARSPAVFEALLAFADAHPGTNPESNRRLLERYSRRGAKVVVSRDGEQIVGGVCYGNCESFFDMSPLAALKLRIKRLGVERFGYGSFLYVRQDFLRTGLSGRLVAEYSKAMLDDGYTHVILRGFSSDKMAEFSLSRPGTVLVDGIVGPDGRPVGLRDLRIVSATAPDH